MRLAHHLKRSRHGVFCFRLTIPAELRAAYNGQREISRSLGTKDPAIAKASAYALSARYSQLFAEYRGLLAVPKWDIDKLMKAADTGRLMTERDTRGNITRVVPENAQERAALPAIITEMAKAGAFNPAPVVELASAPVAQNDPDDIRIVPAVVLYLNTALQNRPENSQDEITKTLNDFANWLRPVNPYLKTITRPKCDEFMEHLLNDKVNKNTGEKGLKPPTVKKQLSIISTFFDRLKEKGRFTGENPAKGVKPLSGRQEAAYEDENSYKRFSDVELDIIFHPKNYLKGRIQSTLPHRFWMPVLALCTGARAEEIAQLRQEDITFDLKNECWCIEIKKVVTKKTRNEAVNKKRKALFDTSVKTHYSDRKIPLHPILIELGFTRYVEKIKEEYPGQRLFPYLKKGKNGFKKNGTRSFADYLDALKIPEPEKVFHSFRSTFNDIGDKADVREELRTKYLGQKWDTVNATHYSEKPTVQEFKNFLIAKIDFVCLRKSINSLKREWSDYRYLARAMRKMNK